MTTNDLKEIEKMAVFTSALRKVGIDNADDRCVTLSGAVEIENTLNDIIDQQNAIIRYLKENEETHNRNND